MKKLFTLAAAVLASVSITWAGVNVFTSQKQVITDGSWEITGPDNSASSQSSVIFPDPAAEPGFPVGTQSAANYFKINGTSDLGAKLTTAKRITIKGLAEGDQITVYWFATNTTKTTVTLSYAHEASKGTKLYDAAQITPVSKTIYASTLPALTSADITKITSAYAESEKLGYISCSNSVYVYAVKIVQATKYTVTYELNGGEGTTPTQADLAAGVKFTLHDGVTGITAPEGKEFTKWKDQDDNEFDGGAQYTMPAKNVTLTAQWRVIPTKYTVTYDLNGAPGDAPTESAKAAGDEFTLADAPEWAGHIFDGWKCNVDDVDYAGGAQYTMTDAATTFTAQWSLPAICAQLYPASTGAEAAEGAEVALTAASDGGKIIFAGAKDGNFAASFLYTEYGLQMCKGGADSVRVELSHNLKEGSIVELKVYQTTIDTKTRGFKLLSTTKSTILTASWVPTESDKERTYSYEVTSSDALNGKNAFLIQRDNTAALQAVIVYECGSEIPTALDNTEASVKATKRIVNGQLFIEKNGVMYNAQGAVVR